MKFLTSSASRIDLSRSRLVRRISQRQMIAMICVRLICQLIPARYYDKTCNMLGSEVHVYGSADFRASWWRQLRAAAAETELGVMLRRVKRRLIRPRLPSIQPKAYHW